nr:hypothetical protein OH820_17955 [Streptomyces sp. NBC_00857]
MSLVAVEIVSRPQAEGTEEEIEFVDDLDVVSSTEVMLGCGDDNPY